MPGSLAASFCSSSLTVSRVFALSYLSVTTRGSPDTSFPGVARKPDRHVSYGRAESWRWTCVNLHRSLARAMQGCGGSVSSRTSAGRTETERPETGPCHGLSDHFQRIETSPWGAEERCVRFGRSTTGWQAVPLRHRPFYRVHLVTKDEVACQWKSPARSPAVSGWQADRARTVATRLGGSDPLSKRRQRVPR